MSKYIAFKNDYGDILLCKLKSFKKLDSLFINNIEYGDDETSDDKIIGTYQLCSFEVGDYVYILFDSAVSSNGAMERLNDAKRALGLSYVETMPYRSSRFRYEMSEKEAKEIMDWYNRSVEHSNEKYFVGDDGDIYRRFFDSRRSEEIYRPEKIDVPIGLVPSNGDLGSLNYILEFEDDASATLWAEVIKAEYVNFERGN